VNRRLRGSFDVLAHAHFFRDIWRHNVQNSEAYLGHASGRLEGEMTGAKSRRILALHLLLVPVLVLREQRHVEKGENAA
jgi:hypothetical protein